jgi:hypothetical protein
MTDRLGEGRFDWDIRDGELEAVEDGGWPVDCQFEALIREKSSVTD